MTDDLKPIRVCSREELRDNCLTDMDVETPEGPRNLMILRDDNGIHGWLNVCPHQGRALNWAPGKFLWDDAGHLVCAAHGAVFRMPDGVCIGGPCKGACLTAVPVDERDDQIVAYFT